MWRDNSKAPQAAEAMKLTATDLLELGIIDKIIPEPMGGAHWDYDAAARNVKKFILDELQNLIPKSPDKLIRERIEKFSKMGFWKE